ncbi:MAG: UDP-glucose 4-epimerase GalE [Thermoguttaceae bacterium]|nr:UDP-glucose 4-epimerase GalE [Thermoguttaceae bacterium]
MNILVTGGAGYIGSHATKLLLDAGHRVVVVDNLSRGYRDAVDARAAFYEVSIAEQSTMEKILHEEKIEGVMHFAAFMQVGESVHEPLMYYDNNTGGAVRLLRAMQKVGVRRFVFSSTAAVYGEPEKTPIREDFTKEPINPYGRSKRFVEQILEEYAAANPEFAYSIFRYFNVAGSAMDGSLGERHDPETHLIPIILQAALGKRKAFTVFGTDYATPDGTCIRDYIHVEDLCDAHIRVMQRLEPGQRRYYNLGIGHGYSVLQVLQAAERVVGHSIPTEYGTRRAGDPARLFADSSLAQKELDWKPRYPELDDMIRSAWNYMKAAT